MSDRMYKKISVLSKLLLLLKKNCKAGQKSKNRFWLFHLCNIEKKAKYAYMGRNKCEKQCSVIGPVFHFIRLRPRIFISVYP